MYQYFGGFMSGEEIKITYDTLFDILRREKDKKEIQKLDENFFANVAAYFSDKKSILDKIDDYSEEEADRIKTQIQNAKRIVREIYNAREKKIVEKAIIKARTKSDIITTENMLDEEKELFNNLVDVLSKERENVLNKIIKGSKIPKKEKAKQEVKKKGVLVRFLVQIPEFVGMDGENYGPFNPDEIALLPEKIANILINTDKAEAIESRD